MCVGLQVYLPASSDNEYDYGPFAMPVTREPISQSLVNWWIYNQTKARYQ